MIKIMVDSASDCRDSSIFDYFIPITIELDGRSYQDGIDIDSNTFYNLLTTTAQFPKTSQPSPDAFRKIFAEAKNNGDEILYFSLSSALSGTFQSASIAKAMAEYDGIYIIDTKAVTHMIGYFARYARTLIAQGLSAAQIAAECESLKGKIKVFAGLDTLEYLYKGGRLSRAAATVGEVAGIKPILTITEEGTVNAGSKAIGMNRAMQTILAKVSCFEIDGRFPMYSLYTHGTENVEKLETKLTAAGYATRQRLQIGSTIGAHTGPGVYGVLFVAK